MDELVDNAEDIAKDEEKKDGRAVSTDASDGAIWFDATQSISADENADVDATSSNADANAKADGNATKADAYNADADAKADEAPDADVSGRPHGASYAAHATSTIRQLRNARIRKPAA